MDAQKISFGLFWIYAVTVLYCNCLTPTLMPVDPEIIEGDDVTFIYTVSDTVDYINWQYHHLERSYYSDRMYPIYSSTPMRYKDGLCETSPEYSRLSNTSLYEYDCNETVYKVTVKNVQREYHGYRWSCFVPNYQASARNSTIHVQVPVESVIVTPVNASIDIIEHTAGVITCKTSETRPDAVVTWYKDEWGEISPINHNITSSITNDNFTVTTSTLSFFPSREQTGTNIFCSASNIINTIPVYSSKSKLNVLYKAEDPVITEGNEYRILEGGVGQLSCYIEGGNPTATIIWGCNDMSTTETETLNNGSTTKTITWTAVRGFDIKCSCTSQQTWFSNTFVNVSVVVLYPPSQPQFKVNGNIIINDISFILGENRSIQCVTDSSPTSSFKWYGSKINDRAIISFDPIQKTHSGLYTCEVNNTMNPSNQNIQSGHSSSSTNLVVLFPPEVQKMENITLVEGSTLDCNCSFTVGVPVDTSIQWIRDFDTSTWNDTRLVIQSVSREDAGKYMCKVSNTMHPTGETQPTPGESQELFHLEVQYETTLTSFSVVGFTQTNVEVNENDRIHLVCTADGIPTPRISLRKKGEILTPAMTDRMDYILENTSCSDTGQYVCSAKNKHNTRGMLIKHIFLFVRCTPRANDAVVTERTTELESTVTFVFNALAYPYPTFTWWKLVKAEWKQLFNEENVIIQSSDFLSNLTIRKVFSTDFTYYKVIISNDIGTNEQIYELLQSEYQNDNGNNPDGGPFNIGSVIGYSVGATVGCFMLIMLSIVLVWIFRFRRAKTNNPTNQAIGMTKVEETASETGFRNSISDAHESNEPSTEGGAYYNEESFSRLTYETLDMENKVLSNYSTVDTTNQGHTDVDDPYVKMN